MTTIYIASFVASALAAACFLALRKLARARGGADLSALTDIQWQACRPLERLLDPAEFARLRERGFSPARVRQLRGRRRALFRMYLRQLTQEFNTLHHALQIVLVHSSVDRPELARELHRQRLLFYRGLIGVELRLALHAAGFDTVPAVGLLRPLERLHLEFCRLAPAAAAA